MVPALFFLVFAMNAYERKEIESVIADIEGQIKRLKALIPAPVKIGLKITHGKPVDKSRLAPFASRGKSRPKNHGMGEDGSQQ